jgi:hypothetical protein
MTDFQTFFVYFHVFQVVEQNGFRTITLKKREISKKSKNSIFCPFLHNFSNIYGVKITFFKKLVEVAPATY